jgi:hypothetical protein
MTNVLLPWKWRRKIKSKQIVEDFLKTGAQSNRIDVKATERDFTTVYNSLYTYLKNHPELGVSLVREEGELVLYRDTV